MSITRRETISRLSWHLYEEKDAYQDTNQAQEYKDKFLIFSTIVECSATPRITTELLLTHSSNVVMQIKLEH